MVIGWGTCHSFENSNSIDLLFTLNAIFAGLFQFFSDSFDIAFRPKRFVELHCQNPNKLFRRALLSSFEGVLFVFSVGVYMADRKPGLSEFPILGGPGYAVYILLIFSGIPLIQAFISSIFRFSFSQFQLRFTLNLLRLTMIMTWLALSFLVIISLTEAFQKYKLEVQFSFIALLISGIFIRTRMLKSTFIDYVFPERSRLLGFLDELAFILSPLIYITIIPMIDKYIIDFF